jgi:septal ring factor EnvC (AmiA/AmiB activator)
MNRDESKINNKEIKKDIARLKNSIDEDKKLAGFIQNRIMSSNWELDSLKKQLEKLESESVNDE